MPSCYAGETNYNVAFYIADGAFVVTATVAFFLKIDMKRSDEKGLKALKNIVSLPALNFFALVFVMGFQWGIHDTYLLVYLDEEMEASSSLISKEWNSLKNSKF